ncbi:MAG: carboxy terminal-processing peptidase [Saprospiraceae bacterium]|nr:carboxy terminal-processing peptidase [Saprospiraceae bacterium]MBK7809938.1 carboxy terminal-processing peptidase [Saprospiraceae bacterium]
MNSKKAWFFMIPILMGLFYLTSQCRPSTPPGSKEQLLLQLIYKQSQTYHYQPPTIDDAFSVKAYDQYLKNMDSGKRFLTKEDIKKLEIYKNQMDDHFRDGNLVMFDQSTDLLKAAILKVENYYNEFLDSKVKLEASGELELDSDKREWASNDRELKEFWQKTLQYDFLSRYYDAMYPEDGQKNERPQDSIIMEIKSDIRESMSNWFKRMNQLTRADRFESYVNTFIHIYDPHTDFLNPKDKEDFNINMSGKLEGIGARLQTEKEYTKVSSIVPGGPAWKQKELEPNDIIMGVQQKDKELVDIKGMLIDEVVKMIRGKKGTEVTLKVKKKDGLIKDITILRDEVIMDEGFARSAILKYDQIEGTVGYLNLPRFYADFENPNGASCARDVQKEIRKLKAEGAQSLIFDLRNNGGGSLQEVVEMAGLFFDKGPVVQVRDRDRVSPYQDTDNGVEFDGPMVVLVNGNSASASEILAACLQDYKRAVIIGNGSTFGKGTVQRFVNFDRIPGNDDYKPLGEMKITIQKYYRVNGGSVQLKGVEPDIILPDLYSYIETGEKEYDNAMPYDVIKSLEPFQSTYSISNLDEIKTKSKERIKNQLEFQKAEKQAKMLKELRDKSKYPLDFVSFKKEMDIRKSTSKIYDDEVRKSIDALKTENLQADMAYIQSDTSRTARNEDFLKYIKKDIYIAESIKVLSDTRPR